MIWRIRNRDKTRPIKQPIKGSLMITAELSFLGGEGGGVGGGGWDSDVNDLIQMKFLKCLRVILHWIK